MTKEEWYEEAAKRLQEIIQRPEGRTTLVRLAQQDWLSKRPLDVPEHSHFVTRR